MTDDVVDLEELIREARRLDPLPSSATRLLDLTVSPDVQLEDVVSVVELDPVLAGSVLRMANSAMSAARREITTVRDAVVRLGIDLVLSSGLSTGIAGRMQQQSPANEQLWRHSVAASMAANHIRRKAKTKIPAEATAAALLVDIGKIVLDRYLANPDVHARIAKTSEALGEDPLQIEASVLWANHAALGGVIAEHWHLPETIVRSIAEHHGPSADAPPVVWATFLAEVVSHRVIENEPDAYAHDANLISAYEVLGLSAGVLPEVAEIVARDLDSVAGALGVN